MGKQDEGIETKVAGREATPGDVAATERLNRYWAEGPGAAKIRWGVPGDFDRCVALLGKYIQDPEVVKGHCQNLHERATGAPAGHAPAELAARAAAGKKGLDPDEEPETAETLMERKSLTAEEMPPVVDVLDLGDGRSLLFGADGSLLTQEVDDTIMQVHGPVLGYTPEETPEDPGPGPLDDSEGLLSAAEVLNGDYDDADLYADGLPDGVETKADGSKDPSDTQRRQWAKQGIAMPDGSFPIPNADYLGRAVTSFGRGNPPPSDSRKKAVRRHIVKRARALGLLSRVPDDWPEKGGSGQKAAPAGETKQANARGSKIADEVAEGDIVSVKGKQGRVAKVTKRGGMVGLSLDGAGTVWVPRTVSVSLLKAPPESKDAGVDVETKQAPYLAGSVEETQAALRAALTDAMLPDEDEDTDSSQADALLDLVATFPDHVICTVYDLSDPTGLDSQSYAVPYTVDDEHNVTLGTPQPVDLTLTVTPDTDDQQTAPTVADVTGVDTGPGLPPGRLPLAGLAAATKGLQAALETKAGRVLSQRNVDRLTQAHAHLTAVLASAGIPPIYDPESSTAPAVQPDGTGTETKALPDGMARITEAELLDAQRAFI